MNKEMVLHFFGGVVNTANALGIKHPAVSRWKSVIPEKQALRIEKITHGKLRYNAQLYE